ncbi:hypothetical protein ACLOJK_030151 [Asimina triloba]
MAEELDDGEFWLPSEFLADDIFMAEKESKGGIENGGGFGFPCEFQYAFESFGSALSSPVESVVGSTETESDEEDYMSGLSRQMAHCMLPDAQKIPSPAHGTGNPKARVLARSPQSTLCAVGCWSGRGLGPCRGGSNAPTQLQSPPAKPLDQRDDSWDFLYAAATHATNMKVMEEGPKFRSHGVVAVPRKQPARPVKSSSVCFHPAQAVTQQQLQVARFQELKHQQMVKQQLSAVWAKQGKALPAAQQQLPNRSRAVAGFDNGRYARPLGLSSSAWPSLQLQQQQPQPGSGMRAVFLGSSGTMRESCGTGVFLPRGAGTPPESRKKPTCSTVLLPARVVQALNLNLDEMGAAHPRFQGVRDHGIFLIPALIFWSRIRGSWSKQQQHDRQQQPRTSAETGRQQHQIPSNYQPRKPPSSGMDILTTYFTNL